MAIPELVDWSGVLFTVSVLKVFTVCQGLEFCTEGNLANAYYMYCEYGCCGNTNNRYCCESFSGVIAGGVIGSILFLGIVVGVIVYVLKKKGHRGAVIAPAGGHITQHSVAFVTATQIQQNYSQPPPAYGVAPGYQSTFSYQPMYAHAGGYPPPPPYHAQDSAYPPPAATYNRDQPTM